MRRFMIGMGLSCVLVACGGVEEEESVVVEAAPQDERALQGGQATAGYPAVGLVVAEDGATCTGTLVEPRVVLTAAHCVQSRVVAFFTGKGRAVNARTGDLEDSLEAMEEHVVLRQAAQPRYQPTTCGASPDLGLLWLGAPVVDITPLRLADAAAARVGRTCTAVGFGVHGRGATATFARKRSGTEEIVEVNDEAVWVRWRTAVADHGDSGGPLLCGGKIAGVVSCGDEGAPPQRSIAYARPQMEPAWYRKVTRGWALRSGG